MAGKTVTLTRNVRIGGKPKKSGDKVQVTADLLAELEAANAVEAKQADDKEGK